MIVEALKASVLRGPKLRAGDSEALFTLSDKIENCCHAMKELNSCELDFTTNLKQIYDRLPDHLQAKWRKSARMFRDKTGGREPTLKDFSYLISIESLTENDPVYSRSNSTPLKVKADISMKCAFHPRFTDSMRLTTLTTDDSEPKPTELKYSSIKDTCKVCKGSHEIHKCPAFLAKNVNWRRQCTLLSLSFTFSFTKGVPSKGRLQCAGLCSPIKSPSTITLNCNNREPS